MVTNESVARARVERMVPGGLGLARIEGRVVLLPAVAPGDLVELAATGASPTVVRVVETSPDRVVPVCQDLQPCGACDLMHLSYAGQLAAKRDIVNDCLRRIGGFRDRDVGEVTPSPSPLAYRSRAAFHVTERGSLGYLARGTHVPIDIERCHVLTPELERHRADWSNAAVACGTRVQTLTAVDRVLSTADATVDTSIVEVGGERYEAGPDSFFQANLPVAAMLVERVLRHADPSQDDTVIDLYAGVGLFSLPLARRTGRVLAVESDIPASELLRRQLARERISNVTVSVEPVEQWLRRADRRLRATTIVTDPPRSGMSASAVKGMVRLRPERIVMVSCDPATMARDLRRLVDGGYGLGEVTAFDMFPQTHHVEIVAHLRRAGDGKSVSR